MLTAILLSCAVLCQAHELRTEHFHAVVDGTGHFTAFADARDAIDYRAENVSAPIARLRGRYRFQLLIKGSDHAAVWQMARQMATASEKLSAAIRVRVDVNPVDML